MEGFAASTGHAVDDPQPFYGRLVGFVEVRVSRRIAGAPSSFAPPITCRLALVSWLHYDMRPNKPLKPKAVNLLRPNAILSTTLYAESVDCICPILAVCRQRFLVLPFFKTGQAGAKPPILDVETLKSSPEIVPYLFVLPLSRYAL